MADSPLQKAPLGLLGALDLKTLGDNPSRFQGTVFPMIDAQEYYLAPNLDIVTATGNAQTSGTEVSYTVPNGYAYRLKAINAGIQLNNVGDLATDGISVRGGIRLPTGIGAVLCSLNAPTVPALVNDTESWTSCWSGDILLPPGSIIFAQLQCGLDQSGLMGLSALVQVIPT